MGCGRHSEAARYPLGTHDYEIRAQFHEGTFHAVGLGPRLGAQRRFLDVWECDLESVRHRLGVTILVQQTKVNSQVGPGLNRCF